MTVSITPCHRRPSDPDKQQAFVRVDAVVARSSVERLAFQIVEVQFHGSPNRVKQSAGNPAQPHCPRSKHNPLSAW